MIKKETEQHVSGVNEELQDIKPLNKYRVHKIVYAHSMSDVEKIITGGETYMIKLIDDPSESKGIGFNRLND